MGIARIKPDLALNAIKLREAYQRLANLENSSEGSKKVVFNNREQKSSSGWREIDGKKYYFRSKWEANYARYLNFLKANNQIKEWHHEPETFWFLKIKRGVRSYLPDFKVIENDGSHHWIEVKGYYDPKSLTKIKRFKKYYPEERITLVDKVWFKENSKKLFTIINGWEKN